MLASGSILPDGDGEQVKTPPASMGRFEELRGKVIQDVWISTDKTCLKFQCNDGVFYLYTSGDCCSESWIEHVDGANCLNGSRIIHSKEMEIGHVIPTRQDDDILYAFHLLLTDADDASSYDARRGYQRFSIEFRNSSNGYYGGEMILCAQYDEEKYGPFVPLTEDF